MLMTLVFHLEKNIPVHCHRQQVLENLLMCPKKLLEEVLFQTFSSSISQQELSGWLGTKSYKGCSTLEENALPHSLIIRSLKGYSKQV